MLVLESSRPVTRCGRPLLSSKRLRCLVLAATLLVASAAPAAAQEPDPEPAPTLPAPDPAPPRAPAPAKPAAAKPAPRPAPAPAPAPARPRYVAPAPAVVTPAPQVRARSQPARRKRVAQKQPAVAKQPETIRRLPIRDGLLPSQGETALVLAAFGVEPARSEDDGLGPIALATAVWLGLALALLAIACLTPFLASQPPLGLFLHERRSQVALVGANMVATAAVCYLVVSTA